MRVAIMSGVLLVTGGAALGAEKGDIAITMTPGRPCWTYHGKGDSFTGSFAANQRVTVHMRGEANYIDPKTNRTYTQTDDRTPTVSGPGDLLMNGEGADLAFVTPRAGVYSFSFSPNAMLGLSGDVTICAR